jgi:RimJ/RimL family protein N-acetyltransferase
MVAEKEDVEDERPFAVECPVLVTDRMVMRPPHEADVPDLAALANDRQLAAMLSTMPHPYGEREAQAFVERQKARRNGVGYALTLADNGAFIGCASIQPGRDGPELGYWIGRPYWGLSYATEAAHALVDLAFRATDTDLLHASCRVVNTPSRRVIQKCGFHYAGPGMAQSRVAGLVPVERYRLDRKTWISLRTWPLN